MDAQKIFSNQELKFKFNLSSATLADQLVNTARIIAA